MRGVLANRRRTADTPDLAAQGQSVSRKTVTEVPLTGLSLGIDFSYPYAIEHDGKLYIGYTHKSHSANELAVIPVAALKAD